MTDTQLEPGGFCAGCGNFVAVRLSDIHKRRGCAARLDNTIRQYRLQHAGTHVALDETVKSFDQDIDEVFKRLNKIDDRDEAAGSQAGITVTSDLDFVPEDDDDLDETVPPARHPLTDVQPRINPVTGLPE